MSICSSLLILANISQRKYYINVVSEKTEKEDGSIFSVWAVSIFCLKALLFDSLTI